MVNAQRLIGLVEDLQVPYLLERSFKLSRQRFNGDRFLLSLPMEALRGREQNLLHGMAGSLAMPDAVLQVLAPALPKLQELHIGYEGQGGAAVIKVYLEQALLVGAQSRSGLLHKAYKWGAPSGESVAVSDYCRVSVSNHDELINRMAATGESANARAGTAGGFGELLKSIAQQLLQLGGAELSFDQLCYLEVQEAQLPRQSFDVKFYDAEIPLIKLTTALAKATAYFNIPSSVVDDLLMQAHSDHLGHWSAGVGRDSQAFMTFYYGVKPF